MNEIPRFSIYKNKDVNELSIQNEIKCIPNPLRIETDPINSKANYSNKIDISKKTIEMEVFLNTIKPIKRKSHHSVFTYSEKKIFDCDKISQSKENVESTIIEKEKHKIVNFLKEKINLTKEINKKRGKSDNSHHSNRKFFHNNILNKHLPNTSSEFVNDTFEKDISYDNILNKESSTVNFHFPNGNNIPKDTILDDILTKYFERNKGLGKDLKKVNRNNNSIENIKKIDKEDKRNLRKNTKIVSDSLEDEDEKVLIKIRENDNFRIFPNSSFKKIWDCLIRSFLIYSLVYSPIFLAFSDKYHSPINNLIDFIIDTIFIIDIIINFFVPFYDNEDNLILDNRLIARNYIRTYFFPDLLAAIPYNTFLLNFQISVKNNQRSFKNISNIFILLRITKVYSLLCSYSSKTKEDSSEWFKDNNFLPGVRRLFIFSVIFLSVSHIISCIWIFLANLDNPNWISNSNLIDLNNIEIYIAAVYFNWSTIFTIGYGDILSYSLYERIYNILIMIIGVLLYSFAVSSIGTMFTTYDEITSKYLKNLEILDEIKLVYPNIDVLQERELNSITEENEEEEWEEEEIIPWRKSKQKNTLYMKLKKFLNYDYKFNKTEKVNFIKDLPNKIRNDLLKEMYQEMIEFSSFFRNNFIKHKNDAFISKVLLNMYPFSARKEELLIKKGEIVEEMLLVNSGKLWIEDQIGEYSYKIISLNKYDYFGVISLLNNEKSEINVKVKSKSAELFLIRKNDLFEISREFPKIFKEIFKASSINYSIIKQLIILKREKINLERTIMKQQKSKISRKNNIIIIEKQPTKLNVPYFSIPKDLESKESFNRNSTLKKQDSRSISSPFNLSYTISDKQIKTDKSTKFLENPVYNLKETDISKKRCSNHTNDSIERNKLISNLNYTGGGSNVMTPIEIKNQISSKSFKGNGPLSDKFIITDKSSFDKNLNDPISRDSERNFNKKREMGPLIRYGSEVIFSNRCVEDITMKNIQRISLMDTTSNHSLDKSLISKISQTVKSKMKQNEILQKNPKKFIYNEFKNIYNKHLISEKNKYEIMICKLDVFFDTLRTKYDKQLDIK